MFFLSFACVLESFSHNAVTRPSLFSNGTIRIKEIMLFTAPSTSAKKMNKPNKGKKKIIIIIKVYVHINLGLNLFFLLLFGLASQILSRFYKLGDKEYFNICCQSIGITS